jgi:ATP-dependent RNA helicase HelY
MTETRVTTNIPLATADEESDAHVQPIIGEIEPEIRAHIDQFEAMYPFPLDDFQRTAIASFERGDSVMVAAPTGSGKTVVAEYGIYASFRTTGRVLYTAPIKALSNQKFRDLRTIYGDDIGLLTGDISENRDARVIVMTTEILRNMLLQSSWELDDVECIIFDEVHYLADPDRGTTWEESIILCPEHIQLICLSATVTNAEEIAGWIGRTHRTIRLVTHTARPVPLALYLFNDGTLSEVVDHHGDQVGDFSNVGGELRRQRGRERRGRGFERADVLEPQAHEIVEQLEDRQLLPAIYFLFSRNDCQAFAERLATMHPLTISSSNAALIAQIVATYLESLRPEDRELDQVKVIVGLAAKGIGFHHAGLLPVLKQLVEVLFTRGLMQVVFATDTLALGVNMPARTVVVGRMSKWDGRQKRPLIPNEFQQMAGRAGRRGMDAFGHVVIPYSPWVPFKEMLEIATGPLLPVLSAFAIRYNTVLNLWDPPDGERVRQMLQRSLAQYQSSQRTRQIDHDILEVESDLHAIPAGCLIGHPEGDGLLDDYSATSRLMQSLQTQERRARKEVRDLERATETDSPWPRPSRQMIRSAFRTARPGMVLHHQEAGWLALLGRGQDQGVGIALRFDDAEILSITEYREIDYLANGVVVDLPQSLHHPATRAEATAALADIDLELLLADVKLIERPDLDRLASEHREAEWERRRVEIQGAEALHRDAANELTAVRNDREAHPCHDCDRRKEHRRYQERRDKLDKERGLLIEGLERHSMAEELRIRNIIRGIRDVLHRFSYLRAGYPTEKADMLADIFDNDGLILCEMIDRGLFDDLSPDEIAEVFSWFSFDREYRYPNHFTLPNRLIQLRQKLEDLERDVIGEERDHRLYISEGHNAAFYGAALAWCRGATMAEVGESLEISEGDLVITFNKTIDLLRQVRDMLGNVAPEHPLRETLTESIRRLRRGIVQQSLALGFTPIIEEDEEDDEESDEGDSAIIEMDADDDPM